MVSVLAKQTAKVDNDMYRSPPVNRSKMLRFSLGIPPSVNHMYRRTRTGGQVLTRQAEDFIRISRARLNEAVEEQHWKKIDNSAWYYLDITFYMPDRRIRDSHNCIKILMDALQSIVYENDFYIMPRIQSVEYDKENPRIIARMTAQTNMDRRKAETI